MNRGEFGDAVLVSDGGEKIRDESVRERERESKSSSQSAFRATILMTDYIKAK